MSFTFLTTTDQVESGKVNCLEIEGQSVVVCMVKEEYFAVENKCSHADQTFDKGRVRGHRLLCPLHGAIFDIRDGSVMSAPAFQPIKSFPLEIRGEEIYIKLD